MIIKFEQVFDTLNLGLHTSRSDSPVERIVQTEENNDGAKAEVEATASTKRVNFSRFHVIEPRFFNVVD